MVISSEKMVIVAIIIFLINTFSLGIALLSLVIVSDSISKKKEKIGIEIHKEMEKIKEQIVENK